MMILLNFLRFEIFYFKAYFILNIKIVIVYVLFNNTSGGKSFLPSFMGPLLHRHSLTFVQTHT